MLEPEIPTMTQHPLQEQLRNPLTKKGDERDRSRIEDLRRENSQLKQVVAEAVLENRVLKKIWWSPVRGTLRATEPRSRSTRSSGLWRARICRYAVQAAMFAKGTDGK